MVCGQNVFIFLFFNHEESFSRCRTKQGAAVGTAFRHAAYADAEAVFRRFDCLHVSLLLVPTGCLLGIPESLVFGA